MTTASLQERFVELLRLRQVGIEKPDLSNPLAAHALVRIERLLAGDFGPRYRAKNSERAKHPLANLIEHLKAAEELIKQCRADALSHCDPNEENANAIFLCCQHEPPEYRLQHIRRLAESSLETGVERDEKSHRALMRDTYIAELYHLFRSQQLPVEWSRFRSFAVAAQAILPPDEREERANATKRINRLRSDPRISRYERSADATVMRWLGEMLDRIRLEPMPQQPAEQWRSTSLLLKEFSEWCSANGSASPDADYFKDAMAATGLPSEFRGGQRRFKLR